MRHLKSKPDTVATVLAIVMTHEHCNPPPASLRRHAIHRHCSSHQSSPPTFLHLAPQIAPAFHSHLCGLIVILRSEVDSGVVRSARVSMAEVDRTQKDLPIGKDFTSAFVTSCDGDVMLDSKMSCRLG